MTETLSFEDVQETIRHGLENGANTAQELTKILRDKGLNIEQPKRLQPTTGLLGRWAKHDAFGDVVVISDHSPYDGDVWVSYTDNGEPDGVSTDDVPLASLTFPEQATKPGDVPAGEAWLVDVEDSEESHKSIVALKDEHDAWRVCGELMTDFFWRDEEVTLISPLVPERPVSDLQVKSTERALDRVKAKYDELESKYREAQERIKALEQALDNLRAVGGTRRVCEEKPDQPAWRIEHDHTNLRVGEYIIDKNNHTGTIRAPELYVKTLWQDTATGAEECAPFIVFPHKDAATPEAIEEAKKARDKETEE